jgi:hypothetical protein
MKGTFFARPLEFKLEIQGEKWFQGETIKTKLLIHNHDQECAKLHNFGLILAHGDSKKVKAKSPDAFKLISSKVMEEIIIPPIGSVELAHDFALDSNCTITEGNSSLYILCSKTEELMNGQHLQLSILPQKCISSFLEIFENFYRFKSKSMKNKKNLLEIKMQAPASKEYAAIEQLILNFKLLDQKMELEFLFKVKKLSYQTEGVAAESLELPFSLSLAKTEYESFGGAPNQTVILKKLEEVLSEVKKKTLY